MFVSGRLHSFKTCRTLVPAAARQPPHRTWIVLSATIDFMLATSVGNGAAWSVATLPAIEAPANPPTNSILRVRMFSSCREIPQARTAARAELGPLRVIFDRVIELSRRVDVRFDPKATKIARRRNMSRRAYSRNRGCNPL
jgi:hypothetical protein